MVADLLQNVVKGRRIYTDFRFVLVNVAFAPVVKQVKLGTFDYRGILLKDPRSDDLVAKFVQIGLKSSIE